MYDRGIISYDILTHLFCILVVSVQTIQKSVENKTAAKVADLRRLNTDL